MTKLDIETTVSMYKEGASYSEIAKVVNKSEHVVKHWVRNKRGEYGLDRRRNLAEKLNNTLSESAFLDSKCDIKRGVELIKRKWV